MASLQEVRDDWLRQPTCDRPVSAIIVCDMDTGGAYPCEKQDEEMILNKRYMKVKIKKLNESAVIPQYAHSTDAGLDLVATSVEVDNDGNLVYGTGLAFEIPVGYVGLVFPRSSVSLRSLVMANSVGVIDSGYRGEVTAKFKPIRQFLQNPYQIGERVAQMVIIPYPHVEFQEVDSLSESDRGTGGYGSTGK